MTTGFPAGLGLSDAEVEQVRQRAVARVQALYDAVMANVIVTAAQPAGWTDVAGAREFDGVITMEIIVERDNNGNFKPPRTWNPNEQVIYGKAPTNELNWLAGSPGFPGIFGFDALQANVTNGVSDPNGVFLNRLPLRMPSGQRVTIDQIATGIGNVAAHEAGHALGLVPNDISNNLRNDWLDRRFDNLVNFDGTTGTDGRSHHAPSDNDTQLMNVGLREFTSQTPTVLTTDPRFRNGSRQEGAYLRIILPRP